MTPIPYKCQFCGREGVAVASEDGDPGWNTLLSHRLVCDRCADYKQGKRKWGESIAQVCAQLRGAQLTSSGISQTLEDEVRKKLRNLTSSYAHIICKYHHIQDIWDEEWINMLVEKPDMVWIILREYERAIPSTKQHAQREMEMKI